MYRVYLRVSLLNAPAGQLFSRTPGQVHRGWRKEGASSRPWQTYKCEKSLRVTELPKDEAKVEPAGYLGPRLYYPYKAYISPDNNSHIRVVSCVRGVFLEILILPSPRLK